VLVSCLPRAEAPAETLQRMTASLQRRALSVQHPLSSEINESATYLLTRRIAAVAAVVGVVAVLAAVVYTMVAPGTSPDKLPAKALLAAADFSGRLELETSDFVRVDAFLNRAIEDNGLLDCLTSASLQDRKVYSLSCAKGHLNLLLADLGGIWQRFDSATLFVETEKFSEPVVVNAITAGQTTEILNQDSLKKCTAVAKDIAVLNNVAELMPGREVFAAMGDNGPGLMTIPKPVLTWKKKMAKDLESPAEKTERVSLTIVLAGSK